LNRLNSSEAQPYKETVPKKKFTNPFAKRNRSMAQTSSPKNRWPWRRALQWAGGVIALLVACTAFLFWLYPSAFSFMNAATVTAAPDKDSKAGSNSVQGKTTDGKKANKVSETKPAETAKADTPPRPSAELVDELPNEAAAGQAWAKKLPADSFVVQHLTLPVFKNAVAWQQANPKLAEAHIVATYKPGEKLAQFTLVSGPFKSRSAAVEFTQQPQTPRLAFAIPSSLLTERLSPSDAKTTLKPKELRR
jgi:hypothetical protein